MEQADWRNSRQHLPLTRMLDFVAWKLKRTSLNLNGCLDIPLTAGMMHLMPIKVCFVALNAYPAIDPEIPGGVGGIETRSWLFARSLAKLPEFEVSFLVRHSTSLLQENVAGVQLHLLRDRYYDVRNSLLSRLRRLNRFPFFWLDQPRWSDLYYLPLLALRKLLIGTGDPRRPSPALEQIDADVYLTFGVQSHSATVIATGQKLGRPVVLFLGSDSDLDERYRPDSNYVSIYRDRGDICYWIMQQATRILCQTSAQQLRLQALFKREADLIRNPIDLAEWDRLQTAPLPVESHHGLEHFALWIGRADRVHKQPQELLQVARRCPEIPFLMVMNPRDDQVEREIREQAPANVRIVDWVPFSHMPALFARAAVLVNTSSLEGFPNTFLQAAAAGVPIASLHVEADFLRQSRAGSCADGNLDRLAELIQEQWQARLASESGTDAGSTARTWIEREHAAASQTGRLAETLKAIVQTPRPRTPREIVANFHDPPRSTE